MMLYISCRDHAGKLKFSSYVHLPSINKNVSISLRLSDSMRCRRHIIFEHGWYISALEHIRTFLSMSVNLTSSQTHRPD